MKSFSSIYIPFRWSLSFPFFCLFITLIEQRVLKQYLSLFRASILCLFCFYHYRLSWWAVFCSKKRIFWCNHSRDCFVCFFARIFQNQNEGLLNFSLSSCLPFFSNLISFKINCWLLNSNFWVSLNFDLSIWIVQTVENPQKPSQKA